MREKQAAMRLESAIGSAVSHGLESTGERDEDLLGRVRVVERLVALEPAVESRVRESLRAQLHQAMEERRARAAEPALRRPWVMRRPVLAAELGVLLAVTLLAVVAPRSLAALLEPVIRLIEVVRVGDHTEIHRSAPRTGAEVSATLEESRRRLWSGELWHLDTPYGGFGGRVPPGEEAVVRRVSNLDALRALTPVALKVPTGLHRDEPVRFDHARVAPDGWVFMFFGSGANELLLAQAPVGDGRVIASVRMGNRTAPDGRTVFESPELKTEEMSFGGQTVVWDPDPESPGPRPPDIFSPGAWSPFRYRSEFSALRWEEDGVSYSLMGGSLTREEAVDLFLSLRPSDELP